ncbi:MAG: acyl-CoA thioesterase [Francisellaceae bacterium]
MGTSCFTDFALAPTARRLLITAQGYPGLLDLAFRSPCLAAFADIDGCQMIFRNLAIAYKKFIAYPERLCINTHLVNISKTQISFYHEIYNRENELTTRAFVDCAFLNPETGSIAQVPDRFRAVLLS